MYLLIFLSSYKKSGRFGIIHSERSEESKVNDKIDASFAGMTTGVRQKSLK